MTSSVDSDELDRCRSELEEAQAKIANLTVGLASARQIGCAVGILMTRFVISYDDAFAMLVMASQQQHRKVRDVAEDVIATGTILVRNE